MPDHIRTARMRDAVRTALADGVFYQRELADRVHAACRADDGAVNLDLGDFDEPQGSFDVRKEFLVDIATQVKAGPRGTWASVRFTHNPERPSWKTLMHDGTGELGVGGSHDCEYARPTWEHAFRRMFDYEVYEARQAAERQTALDRNRDAIVAHRIQPGSVARNLRIGGKFYSTALVEGVDEANGMLALHLTRRGSPHRMRHAGFPAADFAACMADPVAAATDAPDLTDFIGTLPAPRGV